MRSAPRWTFVSGPRAELASLSASSASGLPGRRSRRGWYSVDLRDSSISADQIESLRISGKASPRGGPSYPVLEAAQVGPVVRVRVAEFVNLVDAHLWQNKQSAAYLRVRLREGIAQLADAGLAHDLAAGRLASAPKVVRPVAGFTDQQQEAYESCLSAGVRLVWGPPGTGKTRVLTEAIARLVATGRRVLLVSATNIAVDNALLGVIRSRPFKPGSLLRAGLPHHPGVLQYPDVCLPDLVRKQLADVDRQRQAIKSSGWKCGMQTKRLPGCRRRSPGSMRCNLAKRCNSLPRKRRSQASPRLLHKRVRRCRHAGGTLICCAMK